MQVWFAVASGLIVLVGAPFYLIDILKGTTKPVRMTWLIWSILGIVAFVSQLKLGAHWSLLFVGLEATGNLIIYGLSFKYGIGGWRWNDKVALAVATAGVGLAFAAHSPLIALWGVILADLAGGALTIYKAYQMPSSETVFTWLMLGLSSLLACFAVGKISYQLLLYPVYFTLICWAVPVAQGLGYIHAKAQK
ncbi:MAG: hypothetical protein WC498_01120 [Candidatus Saccharimonadales bacterium]